MTAESPDLTTPMDQDVAARREAYGRQTFVGLALATLVIAAWATCHVYGVFFHRWSPAGVAAAPVLIALQCWLNVGLFIVAHDCMHGSLAPFRPRLNRAIGRLCLALYAGFSYDRLIGKHFAHHRHAGTPLDPDFDENHPSAFWPWFLCFFREYFGWREMATLAALLAVYLVALGASPVNALLLWGVPAILSAIQLFAFGTYLPHRRDEIPFGDRHNARSNDYPVWLSLLTCFHFGYHHEHHDVPSAPWWKLPEIRAGRASGQDAAAAAPSTMSQASSTPPA
ncbi:fatty acid desaturase [Alsobacter sp. KACC 23698]|uniref:Fatty acid desaturase n=1 Tax=Alsobacter sp. KACC 23698 TaxID=3149229 RepID=A0AAU7JL07_9HYPH